MKVYYKAVRPDGTDFATGTTRPVVGEWMPRIEGELILCERGYHVSDAPGVTLIGGSWPCRLFEVEIDEVIPYENVAGHKSVVHTYRPTKELPAWMALGPNGKEVAAIIERVKVLTPDEQVLLSATWNATLGAIRGTALNATRMAAMDATWNATWKAALAAARRAALNAIWDVAFGVTWTAARDAIAATLVRDRITPKQFNTLYEPWRRVINNA